jgi:RND superfamily putative drug exporter
MVFAEFGKFQQAGVAITFSLAVCLSAALTLTPALLRMTGRWAFWPNAPQDHAHGGWISATSLFATLLDRLTIRSMWARVGRALLAHPGRIWLASMALMLPFAAICVMYYSHLTYGLLDELPESDASVIGAAAVQEHFPAGSTGIVKLLLEHDGVDFGSRTEGAEVVEQLTERLNRRKDELGVAGIRSLSRPLGGDESILEGSGSLLRRRTEFDRSQKYYVSGVEPYEDRVTRLEFVFKDDPFSRNSIDQFEKLKATVAQTLQQIPELRGGRVYYVGPTASIRDLKLTTDRDQIVIDVLVLSGVFLILVVLLRRPAISAYLIVSVFFSYLVTLGVTFAVFWALDPAGFPGLDWKVPMFLFTILIAVGEDYNIFLMTRIEEEQANHGRVKGVTVALEKTGSIISSCGFIMAGTFSSLLAGSLVGMHQLGVALAFGVLLDTFVVRPILVPAYLIMLYQGRFGALGRLLGAGGLEPDAEEQGADRLAGPHVLPNPETKSAAKSA